MVDTLGKNTYGVSWHELKSHSSFLTNERIAFLLAELDMVSKTMNEGYTTPSIKRTKSVLYQLWKNIRTLVENNPWCRQALQLNTKQPGVYTIDVMFDQIEKMIMYCELYNKYTFRTNYILSTYLNKIEVSQRSILQYFHYLFRPTFKQKPDIVEATAEFKKLADKLTVEQLRGIAGPNNTIGFDSADVDRGQSEDELIDDVKDVIEEEDS